MTTTVCKDGHLELTMKPDFFLSLTFSSTASFLLSTSSKQIINPIYLEIFYILITKQTQGGRRTLTHSNLFLSCLTALHLSCIIIVLTYEAFIHNRDKRTMLLQYFENFKSQNSADNLRGRHST